MENKVTRIDRITPRPGAVEEPWWSERGYCLADPRHGGQKHHAGNAVYVKTLEEAAELVSRGFSLRMGAKGKRASLVAPASLRVVRA